MLSRRRLSRIVEKNGEEIRALFEGRMPRFVLGSGVADGEVPVFVFHDVTPDAFGEQLRFLVENGYRTIDAGTLVSERRPARGVVLTFDDATWTFAAYAFPLLRRYGCRAVLFVIPGLVPDDATRYPSLDDVDTGGVTLDAVSARGARQPMCTRRELLAMHASGLVDIQSHSLTHQRVPVSPSVVDFLHPGFDADTYGNVRIPVSVLDDPGAPVRALRLGAPVFRSASRLEARRRFVESRDLVETLTSLAASDPAFFEREAWRSELEASLAGWPDDRRGAYETDVEMEQAVRHEIAESKRALEEMLDGKSIEHLCYPWFRGSALADRVAADVGYRATYYGLRPASRPDGTDLLTIARLSEAYLTRLPGSGRRPLLGIWREKLIGRGRPARG